MSIFEDLRALDDLEPLRSLRFESSGLYLWPFVRWIAFSAAQEKALGLQPAHATAAGSSLKARAEFVLRALFRGPMSAGAFDVVMVGSGGGQVLKREGRWFDRINDYLAMELPERTLLLDMAIRGAYKRPRFPPHVRCYDTFDLRAGIQARRGHPSAADLTSIEQLVKFVRERFPVELPANSLEQIRATLIHWSLRLPSLQEMFARFFEHVRPRVLFIEGASYGAFAHVCTWAHAAGIATAELQHGVIARSHLAYNYGDALFADAEFARCLPRHLLLYGEFWKDEVRTPSELVVAGCPHFTESSAGARTPTTVLTISQGICTANMVALTAALAHRLPERKFVFRLHPGEVPFRERYQQLKSISNVEISDSGDIYLRLREASVVIGHSSTALFEAAGMGLPVLVFDDETSRATMPPGFAPMFRDADQLLPLVVSPPTVTVDRDHYFASDWRARYRAFIERVSPQK